MESVCKTHWTNKKELACGRLQGPPLSAGVRL